LEKQSNIELILLTFIHALKKKRFPLKQTKFNPTFKVKYGWVD